jgi:hypothetical protein
MKGGSFYFFLNNPATLDWYEYEREGYVALAVQSSLKEKLEDLGVSLPLSTLL